MKEEVRIQSLLKKHRLEENNEKKLKYCHVLAEHILYNGVMGDNLKNTHPHMFESVGKKYHEPRSLIYYSKYHRVGLKNVKWYLNNKYESKEKIWNGSFIRGISKCGKFSWNGPSLRWSTPKHLDYTFRNLSPYKGISFYCKREFYYSSSYSFFLPCNYDSYHYLAGLLYCSEPYEYEGHIYAKINKRIYECLSKYEIPVEKTIRIKINNCYLISPIWPALFSDMMPMNLWEDVKNPYMAEEYALLLWAKYAGNVSIRTKALPFLKSRRTIYYKYKNMGLDFLKGRSLFEHLEREWVSKNLVSLDVIFRDIVREKIYGEIIKERYLLKSIN